MQRLRVSGLSTGRHGRDERVSSEAIPLLVRTRFATGLPLALGFGLSSREHMEAIAPHADAAVVGSAFMRLIEDHASASDLDERLERLAGEFKDGLKLPETAVASPAG